MLEGHRCNRGGLCPPLSDTRSRLALRTQDSQGQSAGDPLCDILKRLIVIFAPSQSATTILTHFISSLHLRLLSPLSSQTYLVGTLHRLVIAYTLSLPFSPAQGSYVGIHSTGFRDFLLKPELLRAISDLGFEHPSEGE